MPFPNIVGTITSTNGSTASTAPVINLPGSIQAGELLIILIRSGSTGTIGAGTSGFTQLATDLSDASDDTTSIFYKVATASEPATVTFATSNNKFAAISFRVNGAIDPATQLPQLSTVAIGTVAAVDPTTCTPTGGAKDYLWVWMGGWAGTQTSPPASQPTSFSGPTGADTGAGGAAASNCRVGLAWRKFNAASLDAAAWTISAAPTGSTAWLMAIHPRAAPVVNATPQAAFTETGQIATFDLSRVSALGSFTETAFDATLAAGWHLVSDAGSFAETGNAATLTKTAGAAYPKIAAYATTNTGDTQLTFPDLNLPTGIVAGNLLLLFFRCSSGRLVQGPTGFTELIQDDSDASNDGTGIFYRWADGTETSPTTVQISTGKISSISVRITAAANPATQLPELSTVAIGASNTTPDPTACTPTGGAKDYLWIWFGGWPGIQTSPPTNWPSNYTQNQIGADTGVAGALGTNCRVAIATRELHAASEDPGSLTISAVGNWTAWTVAVHPAGGAAYSLVAATGSFTETAQATTLRITLPAAFAAFSETGQAASFSQTRASAPGSFAETGQVASFALSMPAAFGAFAETGPPAALRGVRTLPSVVGSFALTGQLAGLVSSGTGPKTMPAATGSFVETGQAASFAVALPAAQAAFALSGQTATFKVSLLSAQGAFVETGVASGLVTTRKLSAAAGAFAETGLASGFAVALPAAQASFALTGGVASFKVSLLAAQGAFAETAPAVALRALRTLGSAQAAFALTRFDAGLLYSGSGSKTLSAAQGSYALAGQPAALRAARRALAASSSFALTGPASSFAVGLPAAQGAYVLTALAATFKTSLLAASSSFSLTGLAAGLVSSGAGPKTLAAAGASFTETGLVAVLRATHLPLTASQAAYTLTRPAAALVYSGAGPKTLLAALGSFTLTAPVTGLRATHLPLVAAGSSFLETGRPASFLLLRRLVSAQAPFTLTGSAAGFVYSGAGPKTLTAAMGSVALTGRPAAFALPRRLVMTPGAFAWTGLAALLKFSSGAVYGLEFFDQVRARYSTLPSAEPRTQSTLHARGRYSFLTKTQRAA